MTGTPLPRVVVAAPATGQGKTTVATGLMAALRARGLEVSGHKVGPDYIDPGYHALATGRPGRNLDPHLVGEDLVVPLLLHGARVPRPADVAVVEGVMGLHDGRLGADGFASTAHLARLVEAPVLLVLDVGRHSRTAAAIAAGMAVFDPRVRIGGVVLNRAWPGRNTEEIVAALAQVGLPVLGRLPHDDALATPSRHLGLVTAAERDGSAEVVARLGEQVAAHLDLDAVLDLARSAPDLEAAPWDPATAVAAIGGSEPVRPVESGRRPVVAVAGGRAFTFRYAETDELLRAAGCEVVEIDPLHDGALPAGTAGLYLGGGFPEVHAAELAANRSFLAAVAAAVRSGVPTVAECAGLLYLARSLDGEAMAGVVAAEAAMSDRLTLRYPEATAPGDSLLARAGDRVTGHEFHRTRTSPVAGAAPAWVVEGEPTGFAGPSLHASYLHVHWAGHPRLARRFADAVHAFAAGGATAAAPHDPPHDPLRHHGDREVAADDPPVALDLAVNVHPGPRPEWLDAALHGAVADAARYPRVEPATEAVAAHHGRAGAEVLVTAGAAEAFTLLARARPWRRPVVVHPQFTEPHAALEAAGHAVTTVLCRREDGFALDPAAVPGDADLVVLGDPTNPTGVRHPRTTIEALAAVPGRLVVVDEAFLDAGPSLADDPPPAVVVVRSLTKLWALPGVRVGYLVGEPDVVAALARLQAPWSVATAAIAAVTALLGPGADPRAAAEAARRARELAAWREHLAAALTARGVEVVPSSAPFVLARLGPGARARLRAAGVVVRRCDTFPGLDDAWCRLAARPPAVLAPLLAALDPLLAVPATPDLQDQP